MALAALKSLATRTKPASSAYVSTDDALSALIWQCTSRARLSRLGAEVKTTFARAIDPRHYLGLPPTYPGLVQNMAYSTSTIEALVTAPLGVPASDLRAAVDPATSNLGHATRALATAIDRAADKTTINVMAAVDPSKDIALSSWVKPDFYELDFNLGLGKPECVRRPRFTPVESLMYLMPRARDGEIALALCLRDEDMERLKADEEFTKYATYIG